MELKNNILRKKIADLKLLNEQLWIDLYSTRSPSYNESKRKRISNGNSPDIFRQSTVTMATFDSPSPTKRSGSSPRIRDLGFQRFRKMNHQTLSMSIQKCDYSK